MFVSGGRIDHAHHKSIAKSALGETVAFDEAVQEAIEGTDEENTLIVVTADHSHVFNIAGYPKRGNDILGKDALKIPIRLHMLHKILRKN